MLVVNIYFQSVAKDIFMEYYETCDKKKIGLKCVSSGIYQ